MFIILLKIEAVTTSLFQYLATPGANFFGDILQPQGSNPASSDLFGGGFGGFPATNGTSNIAAANQAHNKPGLVAGDLDASLANLTTNLNLAGGHGK